ncbi:RNA 2',3'-cyclic phosphodiesterase [Sphingomonas lacunae]|uniref:RNA 2',3'-cyclic phosphodiesterase n=1 Tax=Sphingomonas lacunae TaxID=2698828 RepID=A0A6M4AVQ0_9SPHN|nr:RNA 2',3'-cyclic phosphodiesterase [Sphingomonas lacunae]QJQ32470.1 RNA 2',3'-cyclic phosphodiesterase [Sphingomonas lacunae]
MKRLFVALEPPLPLRRALINTMGMVSGARWQNDAQLHLTLAFMGDVDEPAAEALDAMLAMISAPPVALRLKGAGSFASRGRVHSLWIGADPREALEQLAKKVSRAGREAGLPVEERAFVPHITVARLNAASGPVDGFLGQWADLTSEPHNVDRFGLYESRMGRSGSAYDLLAEYPLQG